MRESRQPSWDAAVRYRPSAEQVRRHVAYCQAHGIDVIDSCVERWGWAPAILIRMAPRPRKPKGPHSLRTLPV